MKYRSRILYKNCKHSSTRNQDVPRASLESQIIPRLQFLYKYSLRNKKDSNDNVLESSYIIKYVAINLYTWARPTHPNKYDKIKIMEQARKKKSSIQAASSFWKRLTAGLHNFNMQIRTKVITNQFFTSFLIFVLPLNPFLQICVFMWKVTFS